MRKLPLFAALLLLLLLAACEGKPGGPGDDGPDAGDKAPSPIPVEIQKVTRGDIDQTLQSTATVQARHEVLVLAETTGQLIKVLVEEGDPVTEGQELARLSNRQLEQNIPGAEITLSRLRKEREDLAPLVEKGYASRQSLQEIDFQRKQAEAQLRAARGQLQALRITSPLKGLVARRSARLGQQVSPGTELFYLVDPDALEVVLNVPERSLGQIREGGEAYLVSEVFGDALRFPAQVRLINPTVNPRTGTLKVTLRILKVSLDGGPLGPRRLRPGMLVNAHLITAHKDGALLIPKRALLREEDRHHVFLAIATPTGHKALKRSVTPGFQQGDTVEILEGLEEGQDIVVLGQSGLKDEAPLQLVDP